MYYAVSVEIHVCQHRRAIIIIMHLYRTVKIFSSKLPFPFKNYKFYKFFLEISARKRVDFMQLHLV